MLRNIKHHFDSIDGIEIYSIITTLAFILVFVGMVALVFLLKRKYIEEGRNLPLEDDDSDINFNQ